MGCGCVTRLCHLSVCSQTIVALLAMCKYSILKDAVTWGHFCFLLTRRASLWTLIWGAGPIERRRTFLSK